MILCSSCNHPVSFHGNGRTACRAIGCSCAAFQEGTALEIAKQVELAVNGRYSDKPDLFNRLHGSIWTNVEARRHCWDLFTVDDDVALVMVVEGIYEWSDWAAANLHYEGWLLQPLTGYALAIYPESK